MNKKCEIKKEYKQNCGNCIFSSIEVLNDNMIFCEKYKTLENFYSEKNCYKD